MFLQFCFMPCLLIPANEAHIFCSASKVNIELWPPEAMCYRGHFFISEIYFSSKHSATKIQSHAPTGIVHRTFHNGLATLLRVKMSWAWGLGLRLINILQSFHVTVSVSVFLCLAEDRRRWLEICVQKCFSLWDLKYFVPFTTWNW